MRKPPKKARVVCLRGDFSEEIVLQEELLELEAAQRVEWAASRRAALLSERVLAARQRGAAFEDGPLYFDAELKMVRTKKEKLAKPGGER